MGVSWLSRSIFIWLWRKTPSMNGRSVPVTCSGYAALLLDYAPHLGVDEIDDPYYGGAKHFDAVLDHIEAGADGLLAEIRRRLR